MGDGDAAEKVDTFRREPVRRFTLANLGPGYVRATTELVDSIKDEYGLDAVVFGERTMGETTVPRQKYLATQLEED